MYKKKLCLAMAALTLNLSLFAGTPLTRGTQVPIRLTTDATSKNATTPTAIVEKDVTSRDGHLLIRQGTPVEVKVSRQKARSCGRPGSLTLKMVSTQSADGQSIVLEGCQEEEGINKKGSTIGTAVGLGIFVLPFLLILCNKGGEATIPANTTFTNVFVAFDYTID